MELCGGAWFWLKLGSYFRCDPKFWFGHVNRLKLIMRQAYGQTGFELLCKRVTVA
jgi:hypothetical protein